MSIKYVVVLTLVVVLGSPCDGRPNKRATEWTYNGVLTGPDHWGDDCQKDSRQSPINIITANVVSNSKLKKIELVNGYDDDIQNAVMTNNGHSVAVELPQDGRDKLMLKLPGVPGTFKGHSFHFHWGTTPSVGSEHLVDSTAYPMELHIVHVNNKYRSLGDALGHPDGLAVLGFFFEETSADDENEEYAPIVDKFGSIKNKGESTTIGSFKVTGLMDGADLSKYYRYDGSLTTPPCSEVVTWTVFKDTISISAKQMKQFRDVIALPAEMVNNYRPVQDLNCRKVYDSELD